MGEEKKVEPSATQTPGMKVRVQEVIDRILPYVQQDGGHVELVDVNEQDGVVFIRFQGACSGCPSSGATLQMGIESEIRSSIPEINQVVAV